MSLDLDDLAEQAVRHTSTRVPTMSEVRAIARRRSRRRTSAVGLATVLSAALVVGGIWISVRDNSAVTTVAAPDNSDSPTDGGASTVTQWPRFVAAPGWNVIQVDGTTTASNIQLGPDAQSGQTPRDTVDRLERGDVLLFVTSFPAGESTIADAAFPPRQLPLSLTGAQPTAMPGGGSEDSFAEGVQARVDGWNVDVRVFYGDGARPSVESRASAQEQLKNLEVPPRGGRSLSRPPHNACAPSNLRADFDLRQVAGSIEGAIRLHNTSGSSCVVEGFPDIELRDPRTPNADVIPITTSQSAPAWQEAKTGPPEDWPMVRLAPGSQAQAVLTIRNWCTDGSPPHMFTRLPYHLDRVPGITTLEVVPQCEAAERPPEVAIGPLEPLRPTG